MDKNAVYLFCGILFGNKKEEIHTIMCKSTEDTVLSKKVSDKNHIRFSLHIMTKIGTAIKIASGSMCLTRD